MGVVPHDGHLTSFCYAPPDTGVSNLQLVALERLPSIEGAVKIQMGCSFLRGSKAPLPGEAWDLRTPKASPMRGSCRRRRLMRWTASRKHGCPHLIRHGFAVPPSPHRGKALNAYKSINPPRKKVQTSKSGLHLLFMAVVLRQLAANQIPPYQAARTKTPVR